MKRAGSDAAFSGKDRKRAKMRQARQIQVESEHQQFPNNNLTASSSALPPNLNVDKFVQARAFELEAIERSMHTAKTAGNTRAFQSLPRHLRRRAASHNVQRLPLRLRHKARLEIINDKLKHKKRKFRDVPWRKKRKLLHLTKNNILRIRAEKKGWLETHVWHAKRMKMVDKWGHRIAKTPTEKAFRPSYRASQHGCLLHDASYHSIIELVGKEEALKAILKEVVDPFTVSPSAPRYLSGARLAQTTLYSTDSKAHSMVAPVQILWPALDNTSNEDERAALIIVHPSAADPTLDALEKTRSYTTGAVSIRPLDGCVNMFQLSGPKSSAVLSAVLDPVKGLAPEKAAFLKHLTSSSPESLPNGITASMTVHDPRLSFPPKMPTSTPTSSTGPPPIPSAALAGQSKSSFMRFTKVTDPTFSKVDLDKRRSECDVGSKKRRLAPQPEDDTVPVMMYKTRLEPSAASSRSDGVHGVDTLTLMVPGGWAMPFLMSLVYCAPRIAGIEQVRQLHYESGVLAFPHDWPWTGAGARERQMAKDVKQDKWRRTPPAKRVNYAKLGTVSPFAPNLHYSRGESGEVAFNTALKPWYLGGSLLRELLSAEDSTARLKDKTKQNNSKHPEWGSLASAFVGIRIIPADGGSPETNAALYEVEQTKGPSANTTALEVQVDPKRVSGWVLQGGYSLARGKGFGLGCIGFWAARDLFRSQASKQTRMLYKNPKSKDTRPALVELLDA